MRFTPMSWLISAIEMVNLNNKDKPFKVVKQDATSCDVLHRESGALWRFTTAELRKGVDE